MNTHQKGKEERNHWLPIQRASYPRTHIFAQEQALNIPMYARLVNSGEMVC